MWDIHSVYIYVYICIFFIDRKYACICFSVMGLVSALSLTVKPTDKGERKAGDSEAADALSESAGSLEGLGWAYPSWAWLLGGVSVDWEKKPLLPEWDYLSSYSEKIVKEEITFFWRLFSSFSFLNSVSCDRQRELP